MVEYGKVICYHNQLLSFNDIYTLHPSFQNKIEKRKRTPKFVERKTHINDVFEMYPI